MIINENNKNTILKGTVKRGLNQDPNELREKLYKAYQIAPEKKENQNPSGTQKNIKDIFNQLRNLKWK